MGKQSKKKRAAQAAKVMRAQDSKINNGMQSTTDAFSNIMARTGFGTQDMMQATIYPLVRMTQDYPKLTSLYRGNWIVRNIINTIPEDVTKKWYRLGTSMDPEYVKRYERSESRTKVKERVTSGFVWGRLYGGAAGVILIAGQNNLEEPLDLDYIAPDSFKGLYIVDRWSGIFPGIELVDDIYDVDYGLPAYYEVRDKDGIARYRIHHSRIIRFTGRELPWQEAIAEMYWGQSELEAVYEDLVRRDNVVSNMASLTFKANLDVMSIENVDQMLSLAGSEQQRRFWNVLQAQSVIQSNFGTRVISSRDKFEQHKYDFAGLPDVYKSILMDVAGASRTPATKLYGWSPQGMNATGESDQQNYDDTIDKIRENELRPILEKLVPIECISNFGYIPDDMEILYSPIRTTTETQQAEIGERKTKTLTLAFENDGIDLSTYRKEMKELSETTGMFSNITDDMIKEGIGIYKSNLTAMQDPLAGLSLPDIESYGMQAEAQEYPLQFGTEESREIETETEAEGA